MILKMKDKYIVSLLQAIHRCEQVGGIPDYFEINEKEAIELIKELRILQVQSKHSSKFKISGSLTWEEFISSDETNLDRWKNREIQLFLDGIEIRIN